MLPIAAVVALNVAVVAEAATVTDFATVRVELLLERVTLTPPVGAAWFRVTVQVLDEFGPRLVGLHTRDDTSTGAAKLTLTVAELPL